jgi:hypothetical protein
MAGRVIRMQHQPLDISRAEMEHPCLMMINPDNRMKVMAIHEAAPPFA